VSTPARLERKQRGFFVGSTFLSFFFFFCRRDWDSLGKVCFLLLLFFFLLKKPKDESSLVAGTRTLLVDAATQLLGRRMISFGSACLSPTRACFSISLKKMVCVREQKKIPASNLFPSSISVQTFHRVFDWSLLDDTRHNNGKEDESNSCGNASHAHVYQSA
jgi:hypothetical protein